MTAAVGSPYAQHEVRNELKPSKLDGLSDEMLEQHWKLYKGYVTNVNLLNKTVWDCLESGGALNEPRMAETQRRLGFEYNGMILHEHYFEQMKTVPRALPPSSALAKSFTDGFGGVDRWREQFTQIGKMRGVGWVVTSLSPSSHRLINLWIGDHEVGHVAGFVPVVVMDVWEHAYVGDFGSSAEGRAKYIDVFLRNLDWDVIAARLPEARPVGPNRR
jgi:Fe-Mn family superoxide dismutase